MFLLAVGVPSGMSLPVDEFAAFARDEAAATDSPLGDALAELAVAVDSVAAVRELREDV